VIVLWYESLILFPLCRSNLLLQVLGNGELLEFDSPHVLLSNRESQFVSLVEQTGSAEAEYLRMLASVASLKVKSIEQKLNDNSHDELPREEGENDPLIV